MNLLQTTAAALSLVLLAEPAAAATVSFVCPQVGHARVLDLALNTATLHAATAAGPDRWSYDDGADSRETHHYDGTKICTRTRQFVAATPDSFTITVATRLLAAREGVCQSNTALYQRWVWRMDRKTGTLRRTVFVAGSPTRAHDDVARLDATYLRSSGVGFTEDRELREVFQCQPARPE
jgi:hypothetical protein